MEHMMLPENRWRRAVPQAVQSRRLHHEVEAAFDGVLQVNDTLLVRAPHLLPLLVVILEGTEPRWPLEVSNLVLDDAQSRHETQPQAHENQPAQEDDRVQNRCEAGFGARKVTNQGDPERLFWLSVGTSNLYLQPGQNPP